ncbi:MAG: hypothetical protein ACRCZJ_02080 [Erysipelotrichaceae bacterium]
MQQLLKITTTPIKVRVEVERGKYVEQKQVAKAKPSAQTKQVKTQRIDTLRVQQNTTPMKTQQLQPNKTQDTASFQLQAKSLQEGMQSVHDVVLQRLNSEVLNHVVYMSNSNQAKVEPDSLQLEFQPLKIDFDFSQLKAQMQFQPGSLQFIIDTYPDVAIEYIGDPIYVPASSDPNYEGE